MLFIVLIVLCVLRFQDLGLKAVHHDESINGWFTQQVWNNGWYNYDPTNYHGPLQFYLFQFGELLNGFGIETLRGVTVLFSCFWLVYLWRFWTRYQWASKWFLFVVAISPGFLFYSRSAIHEMPFLFFLTLALGGLVEILHYQQGRGWRSLVWGLAGAILLKETWVILALALVLAALIAGLAQRQSWLWRFLQDPRGETRTYRLRLQTTLPPDLILHIGLAVLLIVAMYTGFGRKPEGLKDLVITYLPWFKTGVHSGGHDKPFTYWFTMLWRYEKPLLFLFLGAGTSFLFFWRRLSPVARFLGLGAFINVLIYSLIPYKTPWCFLSVWGPLVFAYGLIKTETRWIRFADPFRVILGVAALISLPYQWEQTRVLNFVNPADPHHDYVYVQTDQRLKTLVDQLQAAAEKNPALYHERIMMAGTEPWPLAWWLGRFRGQNFTPLTKSDFPAALFVVADEKDEALARAKYPDADYEVMKFPIREGREPSLYFVNKKMLAGFQIPPATLPGPLEDVPSPEPIPVKEGER